MTPETIGSVTTWGERVREVRPGRRTLLWWALLLNAEAIAVLVYVSLPSVTPTAVRYYLYPFVWINVGLWAISRTSPRRTSPRRRYGAATLSIGYFLVLAYVGGLIGGGISGPAATGFRIAMLPPGWGPGVIYSGALVRVTLLPFEIVGYAALTYLVYATILDAAGSAIGGVLGLLSCVSCTWPVLASLVGGIVGSASGVAAAVTTQSYGLSTVVFCVTVCLLYWRPFGR